MVYSKLSIDWKWALSKNAVKFDNNKSNKTK